MITIEVITAIINQNPTAEYVAIVNSRSWALTGYAMKAFLRPEDEITYFKRS